jgi:hypothetical protein
MTCEREGVYVERALQSPKAHVMIDGTEHDIDHVGQDDATEPVFRFVFQLGIGYMIYLWVVGRRPDGFFHSYWTKDCAVAEVDMEEHGPPARVLLAPLALPALYAGVTIEGRQRPIEGVTFEADIGGTTKRLEARWALAGGRALTWDGDAWRLDGREVDRVVFA